MHCVVLKKKKTENRLFPGNTLKCPKRRDAYTAGPVIALLLTGAAGADGIVRSLLRPTGICILGDDASDLTPDIKLGQVYIWNAEKCATPSTHVLDKIRGDFDG